MFTILRILIFVEKELIVSDDGSKVTCVNTTRCPCKVCKLKRNESSRRRHHANREARLARRRISNEPRKAEIEAYQRKYREENKEILSQKKKEYVAENREKVSHQRKEGYRRNIDKISARTRDYYAKNQTELLAYAKDFRDNRMHPEYKIWDGIKQRCLNETSHAYHRYGGRGITICDRWTGHDGFNNFIADMGPRPEPKSEYSIDRVDNHGNYEPSNCRWATWKEQHNNKRTNLSYRTSISEESIITFQRKDMTLLEFSQTTDIPLIVCKYRYAKNQDWKWVTHGEIDNRRYPLKGWNYNLTELSLISGIESVLIGSRINRYGWTVEAAIKSDS